VKPAAGHRPFSLFLPGSCPNYRDRRTARTEKRAKKEIERVFVTADAGFLIPQQA